MTADVTHLSPRNIQQRTTWQECCEFWLWSVNCMCLGEMLWQKQVRREGQVSSELSCPWLVDRQSVRIPAAGRKHEATCGWVESIWWTQSSGVVVELCPRRRQYRKRLWGVSLLCSLLCGWMHQNVMESTMRTHKYQNIWSRNMTTNVGRIWADY